MEPTWSGTYACASATVDACGHCAGQATSCEYGQSPPYLFGRISLLYCGLAVSTAILARVATAPRDACQGASERVHKAHSKAFAALGWHVAQMPLLCMALMGFAAIAMGCGVAEMISNNDPLSLWLPSEAVALASERSEAACTQPPCYKVSLKHIHTPIVREPDCGRVGGAAQHGTPTRVSDFGHASHHPNSDDVE